LSYVSFINVHSQSQLGASTFSNILKIKFTFYFNNKKGYRRPIVFFEKIICYILHQTYYFANVLYYS